MPVGSKKEVYFWPNGTRLIEGTDPGILTSLERMHQGLPVLNGVPS